MSVSIHESQLHTMAAQSCDEIIIMLGIGMEGYG